jgi:hypothetical protein
MVKRLTPNDYIQALWGAMSAFGVLNIPIVFVPEFKRVFAAAIVVLVVIIGIALYRGVMDTDFAAHLLLDVGIALLFSGLVGYVILAKPPNVVAMAFIITLLGAISLDLGTELIPRN